MIPAAGAHGGDAVRVARSLGVSPDDLLDLSQTLNPFAPDVVPIATARLGELRRYPDPGDATRCLAETLGVAPERVLITNGGSEAIHLVASTIGGRVVAEPEFALHPRDRTGPAWRSDPHSPSGRLADPDERAEVWDEAFYPLATGRWTAGRPGVAVGSLTKTFACPGLRLGYVIADEATIAALATRQAHWSVGTLALAVLPDLLDAADLTAWSRQIAEARSEMVTALRHRGLEVDAADAPWVLVRGPGLRDRLAHERVLVRDCTTFGLPDHTRIAVPDEHGLERLLVAVDKALPDGAGALTGPGSPTADQL